MFSNFELSWHLFWVFIYHQTPSHFTSSTSTTTSPSPINEDIVIMLRTLTAVVLHRCRRCCYCRSFLPESCSLPSYLCQLCFISKWLDISSFEHVCVCVCVRICTFMRFVCVCAFMCLFRLQQNIAAKMFAIFFYFLLFYFCSKLQYVLTYSHIYSSVCAYNIKYLCLCILYPSTRK